tara:strand:- start:3899 stop:4645 length:747 start_codon:yes stop_codon:yes gene_type:complete
MPKAIKSAIIYRGPSLIDGAPIVVIAIDSARNTKTGRMVQTYILRADMDPRDASKSGADASICGTCPHRGAPTDDPNAKQAKNRSCYVLLGQGPLTAYQSMLRGVYPEITGHAAIAALGAGKLVRLGTYGDPAAVPSYVWESLLSEAAGHTAYSHQTATPGAAFRSAYMMESADNEAQARAAWAAGRRTFRVVKSIDDIVKGAEILCPASKEAGRRVTCSQCKLCGGASVAGKSIAIPDHGPQRKRAA